MGKTVWHMTVTSIEVLAARVSGFMTGCTTLSQSWHLYSAKVCSGHTALLCVVSEILSIPEPVFFILFYVQFIVSMKKKKILTMYLK